MRLPQSLLRLLTLFVMFYIGRGAEDQLSLHELTLDSSQRRLVTGLDLDECEEEKFSLNHTVFEVLLPYPIVDAQDENENWDYNLKTKLGESSFVHHVSSLYWWGRDTKIYQEFTQRFNRDIKKDGRWDGELKHSTPYGGWIRELAVNDVQPYQRLWLNPLG
ncbi:hypothetical protein NDU88_003939 [Pleurodeles waltl]|uniref:Uncharacterized protein n=1 Tax=Pleurodeles waltl TaxID=8319 RepID=A0AAV7LGW5_PLEWA|nr:hypothetical protein NDU88_003939 [Pleurodeles waltl]